MQVRSVSLSERERAGGDCSVGSVLKQNSVVLYIWSHQRKETTNGVALSGKSTGQNRKSIGDYSAMELYLKQRLGLKERS